VRIHDRLIDDPDLLAGQVTNLNRIGCGLERRR
jgi:hypothetical protein